MRKVWQDNNDACFRAAVAMVLDRDYREVPCIRAAGNPAFWNEWLNWLVLEQQVGVTFAQTKSKADWPVGPWIAVVPARHGAPTQQHAIVMDGYRLFHDPDRFTPRKKTPQWVTFGIELNA